MRAPSNGGQQEARLPPPFNFSPPPTPGSLSVTLDKLRAQKSDPEHPGRLVAEVAMGNVARALDLLCRHPEEASP